MKTKTITLYQFDELSENAKKRALEIMIEINVDYEWWDSTYEDAARIDLKITSFDMDQYCNGEFLSSASECANKILKEHGEKCETYKTAKQFLEDRDALVEKYSDGKVKCTVMEENIYDFDNECDELEEEFLKSLLEDYRIMLRNEYEYQMSDEAIIETIRANEYEFTEEGERV